MDRYSITALVFNYVGFFDSARLVCTRFQSIRCCKSLLMLSVFLILHCFKSYSGEMFSQQFQKRLNLSFNPLPYKSCLLFDFAGNDMHSRSQSPLLLLITNKTSSSGDENELYVFDFCFTSHIKFQFIRAKKSCTQQCIFLERSTVVYLKYLFLTKSKCSEMSSLIFPKLHTFSRMIRSP